MGLTYPEISELRVRFDPLASNPVNVLLVITTALTSEKPATPENGCPTAFAGIVLG
jgi:hypothetical protein